MACIWRLHSHRGKDGHCYLPHPHMVCVYFFFDHGLATDRLFCARFLDEYKAIHFIGKKKSVALALIK